MTRKEARAQASHRLELILDSAEMNGVKVNLHDIWIPEHAQVTFSADGTKVFIDAVVTLEIPQE